jgi:hypothetical protein
LIELLPQLTTKVFIASSKSQTGLVMPDEKQVGALKLEHRASQVKPAGRNLIEIQRRVSRRDPIAAHSRETS